MSDVQREWKIVFPAPAGMNRLIKGVWVSINGVPRTRGDEPSQRWNESRTYECSPHPRG